MRERLDLPIPVIPNLTRAQDKMDTPHRGSPTAREASTADAWSWPDLGFQPQNTERRGDQALGSFK